ncbi:MAG TPA: YicC/YloC family endoribonuclease [Chlamydiales bacterium]|nr:YicC/YloC family endoribonuclease [Chlamydiales bacterium]
MTGFGRSAFDAPFGRLGVEIQSVNRKYLEIFISLPKEFSRFEPEVRKWVQEAAVRGQVSVKVHFTPNANAIKELLPDVEVLKGLKWGWEKVAQQLGYDPKSIDLPFLMERMPEQTKQEGARDEDLPVLHRCIDEALQGFLQMKKTEGKALAKDLAARLEGLKKLLDEIEALSPDATKRMREKLLEKMAEVLKGGPELEERLLREVALFAERVDISEEITRLRSHFVQFKELLSPKAGAIGRKMDFLVQEMAREINTIGSKSAESKISHLVVEMKSELEKMREQIQNIE